MRVQMLVPVLPLSGAVVPAFAVVAQSLPYSADTRKLPFDHAGRLQRRRRHAPRRPDAASGRMR
jgi:hypothetical protein